MRLPAPFCAALAAAALSLWGCDTRKSFVVRSDPPGAEVTADGKVAGVTPTAVLLDTKQEEHVIVLRRAGYTTVEQRVATKPMLEGPTENCAAVACSPCCFFVPIALCYERTFTPKALDVKLEREGQGLEVVCRPVGAQIWVDGAMVAQAQPSREETVEGNTRVRFPSDFGVATVPLPPKVIALEIRADGYVTSETQVLIRAGEYIHLRIELLPKTAPPPRP